MKTGKVFMLVIFFSILIIMNLFVFASVENQLLDTDKLEETVLIKAGTYTGSLGEKEEGGQRDNEDYYSTEVEEGQLITLQLTAQTNVSYGISLLTPTTHYSRGSVTTQGGTIYQGRSITRVKTLDYVADSTGTWYIKISRSSGEGEYQLAVNTSIDNDGEPGNNPPVIFSFDASQNPVEVNQTVTITCSASDQDIEETFTFRWSVNGEIIEEESSSLSWRAPGTAGTYSITCTVSDGRGGDDSELVSITVTELSNGDNDNIEEVNYRIEITTGTRIAAGTDANVYITLFDKDGYDSGEILLDNPGVNDFERGDTNTFLVTALNMEDLDYIIIRHDNSGNYPGWYVDEIQVSNEEINKEWNFPLYQWLATDEPPNYQTQGRFYPEYSFSSYDSHFFSSGGTGEFTVTPSSSDCQWTAETDVSWIKINSGGTGPGNKTLSFSVQNNTSEEERIGHITIENQDYITPLLRNLD